LLCNCCSSDNYSANNSKYAVTAAGYCFQMLLATRSPEVSADNMIQQGEGSIHDIITLEDSECHYGVHVARYTALTNNTHTHISLLGQTQIVLYVVYH